MTPILAFDDLVVAVLSYVSFAVLYFARFIMVAIYHFSWVFLSIMAPILLLFHVFSSTVTVNLFRSMFEIASWKVVWSVLSALLKALPFGTWYAMDGNYLTIIVLNFVIAICMVGTPLVVRALVGSGFSAMAGGLTGAAAAVMIAAPAKALAVKGMAGQFLGDMHGFGQRLNSKLGQGGMSTALRPPPTSSQPPATNSPPPPTSPPKPPRK